MTHVVAPRSPRALTAIAAVLALSTIPVGGIAVAQDVQPSAPTAAPSLSLPQDLNAAPPSSTPSTPAAPAVTLPPEATAPANAPGDAATTAGTSPQPAVPVAPTVQPVPTAQQTVVLPDAAPPATPDEAAAPARPAPRAAAPARSSVTAAAALAPMRPTVPTAQDNGTAADGALAEGSVPPAAPAPARSDAVPAAQQPAPPPVADANTSNGVPVAEIAGILAALGVAGLGIFAIRRRRAEPAYEEVEYAPQPLEPVVVAEPVPAPVMETVEPAPVHRAPVGTETRVTAGAAAGAGAILAASPLPETAEERYELLDRMAAAEPDEGNPFTSRKGRLRRARLQLQHREHVEAERGTPRVGTDERFDFRTYRPTTKTSGASTPASREFTEA